ncbi:MAG: Response regulator receiver domain [Planctomycetota bacterium]
MGCMSDTRGDHSDAVRAAHALRDREESDRLRQLGGLLVHDLNNVLFALLGRIQLLERRAEGDTTRLAARELLETARLLEAQVRTLYEACRREEPGEVRSQARPAVARALEACCDALPESIRPTAIEALVETIPSSAHFEGSEDQLRAAVAQALSLHRPRARAPIELSLAIIAGDPTRLEIVLEDSAGIPATIPVAPSLLGGTFDLAGLPLAAAHRAIRDFGGRIACESTARGLRTRLSFEIATATRIARLDASGEELASAGSCEHEDECAPEARRVLIADDDPAVRAVLVAALEAVGDDVDTLSDPGACDAHADLDAFDVVILDAGGGGLEALDRLRARGVEVPVLVASGELVERTGDRFTRCTMKPFSLDTLDRELSSLARLRPRDGA